MNSLYNLSLTFIDFIVPFVTHGLLLSFSFFGGFFSLMGHVYQGTYKKSQNKLDFRTISIFSIARDQSIALRFLSKGIHIEIREISEHSLIAIFGDIIFLKFLEDNKLWKMI